jgi:hypothetical protein
MRPGPGGLAGGSGGEDVAGPGPSCGYAQAQTAATAHQSSGHREQRLGTDHRRGDRLRVADGDGQLHESRDGGRTWTPVGVPAWEQHELLMVYTAVFDPYDLNHVVPGAATEGAPGPRPPG